MLSSISVRRTARRRKEPICFVCTEVKPPAVEIPPGHRRRRCNGCLCPVLAEIALLEHAQLHRVRPTLLCEKCYDDGLEPFQS